MEEGKIGKNIVIGDLELIHMVFVEIHNIYSLTIIHNIYTPVVFD